MTTGDVDDEFEEACRQRTRDQWAALLDPKYVSDDFIFGTRDDLDSDDPADVAYICSKDFVLVADGEAEATLAAYFEKRLFEQSDSTLSAERLNDPGSTQTPSRDGLARRYRLPTRSVSINSRTDFITTLREIDGRFGQGFAVPDHVVHLTPTGSGKICPATEPEVPDQPVIDPPLSPDTNAGRGVTVVVIDTGWYDGARGVHHWLDGVDGDNEHTRIPAPSPGVPLPELGIYQGHGTFIAGVVKSRARACTVHVIPFDIDIDRIVDRPRGGGALLESELVTLLDLALTKKPDLINVSAGCTTRLDHPAMALERWYASIYDTHRDLLIVAAAGNDHNSEQFWPASSGWAMGIGSVNRSGEISDFSNFGPSVDAYALGRHHVNAFPIGTYTCKEGVEKNTVREFPSMLAKWSGTSFAAPMVTGLVAAHMTSTTPRLNAPDAFQSLCAAAVDHQGKGFGNKPVLA